MQLRFTSRIAQSTAFFSSRLPIFFLYLRLFGRRKGVKYAVYVGLVVNLVLHVIVIALVAHYCSPASGYAWGVPKYLQYCKKAAAEPILQGVTNVVLDLYIFILPLPIIWNLQMPFRKRIGVIAIFTTGSM